VIGLRWPVFGSAQTDEHVARVLADFTAARRAALRSLLARGQAAGELVMDADLDMLVDMTYGVLYYRLLVGTPRWTAPPPARCRANQIQ
jgi:hypothetical protein